MSGPRRFACRKPMAGVAAIELALLLPMLLLIVLLVTDFARAMQAEMILVNMSREGASLSARSSAYTEQQVMDALASTAPPLLMQANGMIYITRVMGNTEDAVVRNVVVAQSRWANGFQSSGYTPLSAVWNCGGAAHWAADSTCAGIPPPGTAAPTAKVLAGKLADGQIVYTVEVFYRFDMLFGALNLGGGIVTPTVAHDLGAMSVM